MSVVPLKISYRDLTVEVQFKSRVSVAVKLSLILTVNSYMYFQSFKDIKIKRFINVEYMEAVRLSRIQRRFDLDYLWRETPTNGQVSNYIYDLGEEDYFCLRNLFRVDGEDDARAATNWSFVDRWIDDHQNLWDKWLARLEGLRLEMHTGR